MRDSVGREHRTVTRVTTILEAAAAHPEGVKLTALSALLDAPKSSVHGLVSGLLATGYLSDRDGGYVLGPAVSLLPQPSKPSVLAHARRSLETLQAQCDETATLSLLVGGSVVYVDIVESKQSIRYSAPLRVRRPLYPTSSGKCFLAHMPRGQRDSYLNDTISDAAALDKIHEELDSVRREGVAYNRGETVPDVFAVASPVLVRGRAVACLSVAGPRQRMEPVIDSLAEMVRTESQRLAGGAR
jgi:DNA-binding IclR family transcriptional regulator